MNLIERIEELAETLPRPAYSVADETGNAYVIQWMLEDGLQVRQDEYGNIIGRIDGEGKPIVVGSHTDTVATAGKYDGALGVLAGIEAARMLKR